MIAKIRLRLRAKSLMPSKKAAFSIELKNQFILLVTQIRAGAQSNLPGITSRTSKLKHQRKTLISEGREGKVVNRQKEKKNCMQNHTGS